MPNRIGSEYFLLARSGPSFDTAQGCQKRIFPEALFSSSAEPGARRESNEFSYFRG
jgi:hypothetical protein